MSETRADYAVSMPSWNGAKDFIAWCIDNGVSIEPHTDGTVSSGVPPRLGHLQGTIASVVDQHANELRCLLLGIPSKLPPPSSGSSSNQVIGYSGTSGTSGTSGSSGTVESFESFGSGVFEGSLTASQVEAIELAIRLTVGLPFRLPSRGKKKKQTEEEQKKKQTEQKCGLWYFVRMVFWVLGERRPDAGLGEELAMQWFASFDQSSRKLKIAPGDLCRLFGLKMLLVRKADEVFGGRVLAESIDPPWFVERLALVNRDDPYVWLARLVVAMDRLSKDGTFKFPCREAAVSSGLKGHFQRVNEQLSVWAAQGVLQLVERGSGVRGSGKANVYRLIGQAYRSDQSADEPKEAALAEPTVIAEPIVIADDTGLCDRCQSKLLAIPTFDGFENLECVSCDRCIGCRPAKSMAKSNSTNEAFG